MLLIDKLYRKIGFNKPGHFMSPPAIEDRTMIYPVLSEFFNFKVTDLSESVSRNNGLLYKPEKIFVITKLNYGKEIEGRFRLMPFNINKYITDMGSKEKSMIFLRPTEAKRTISRQTLLVYNYGCINYHVRYHETAFTKLWKYKNTFNSMLEDINKLSGKSKFVLFELPDYLPSREKLEVFSKDLTLPRLKSLPNYKYLNLLEIWKFLTPELKDKSLLSKINPEIRDDVFLLLSVNSSVVLFNLGIMERLVKEYNVNEKEVISTEDYVSSWENIYGLNGLTPSFEAVNMLTKSVYPSKILKRLFYVLVNKMASKKTVYECPSEDAIMKGFSSDVKIDKAKVTTQPIENLKVSEGDIVLPGGSLEKALDKVIESDTPIYNTKDQNDNDIFGERRLDENDDEDEEISSADANVVIEKSDDFISYNSIEEILKEEPDIIPMSISKSINALKDNGLLSKAQEANIRNHIAYQKHDTSAYPELGSLTIEEILDDSKDEMSDTIVKETIRDTNVVFDKSFNYNTVNQLDKHYITKNMKKDTVRTVYSLQNSNMVVESHDVRIKEDILGGVEFHEVRVKPLNSSPVTLKFSLPIIAKDGTFKMSGNTYRMRKQRTEIPIRKISPTQVVLNSYYGKLFVTKAINKSDDFGYWLQREILKNDDDFRGVVLDTLDPVDLDIPRIYGEISRYIKSFYYKSYWFSFDYNNRFNLDLESDFLNTLKEVEKTNKVIFVGADTNNGYFFLNNKDEILLYTSKNNGLENKGKFIEFLGFKSSETPIEFASLKIVKTNVPVGIILSYYIGIDNLLKILKTKHVLLDIEEVRSSKKLDFVNPYIIRFRDYALVIERDFAKGDLILGGLKNLKALRDVSYSSLLSKDMFGSVFSTLDYPLLYVTEIKTLETMFVDPMTKSLLRQMNLPMTFKGMLLKACELLEDDNYKHPNDVSGQVVKGYERINGMLYKTMVNAIKDHENRSSFSRSKLAIDPYEVMAKIKEDSTTVLVDDLNPISYIKQTEDVSYLGEGGRSAIAMTKKTRVMHPSEVGFMSEATKDNGQVGVTAYFTPDPNVVNIRGTIKERNAKDLEWGQMLSTPANVTPFGTHDDSNRLNFRPAIW